MRRVEEARGRGVEKKTAARRWPDVIDPSLVEIRPEPSPAERAAILIALARMLEATRIDAPQPTAWALAGRRESRPGGAGGFRTGWGRGSDRLAGW